MTKVMVDVSKVNWDLLRAQKRMLLDLDDNAHADGLVNFIDDIQEQAANLLGEEVVFGPNSEPE